MYNKRQIEIYKSDTNVEGFFFKKNDEVKI